MKKIYASPGRSRLLCVLKHSFFTFFLLCFTAVTAMAQDALSKKVSVNLKDELLGQALEKISEASGVKFTYDGKVASSTIKVTVSAKDTKLSDVLAEAFKA